MNEPTTHVIAKTASVMTYGGASGAVFFGLTANEFAALGGLAVAVVSMVVGTAVNIYFKRQHLQLARAKAAEEEE